MSKPFDEYKKVDNLPSGTSLAACPVCSSPAELWSYSASNDGPTTRVVMCSNGEQFGPQDGELNCGCLLYLPPNGFYMPTMREAIKYWNSYSTELQKMRRARNWEMHKVTRHD